jgi:hypothetical protein
VRKRYCAKMLFCEGFIVDVAWSSNSGTRRSTDSATHDARIGNGGERRQRRVKGRLSQIW